MNKAKAIREIDKTTQIIFKGIKKDIKQWKIKKENY